MEILKATILNGSRRNLTIHLSLKSSLSSTLQWVREDEAMIFEITLPKENTEVRLNLYDHSINPTESIMDSGGDVIHIWRPKSRENWSFEYMFFNYFGIAELRINYNDINGALTEVEFEPLEVLSSKAKAQNVESMINYLSSIGEEKLHSLFQTTKFNSGYREGFGSPVSYLERLEKSVDIISYHLHQIIRRPITKLSPIPSIINPCDSEQFDETSIAWLLGNLSVLEPINSLEDSHLSHDGYFYRASSLQVSSIKEETNIYENRVIYAAILFMKQKTIEQLEVYKEVTKTTKRTKDFPKGYVSFFSQISKLKKQLLGSQLERCSSLLCILNQLKVSFERSLTVNKAVIARPMLTAKAASNTSYRIIFIEFINWIECNKADWSLYKSLIAITSIPKVFELYTYHRIEETLHKIIYREKSAEWIVNDIEVSLHYEPTYWISGHSHENNCKIINSEGKRINTKGEIVNRSIDYKYSNRSPDYVIEIKSEKIGIKLIILDAKYTSAKKAFSDYLPECTMKYFHGISLRESKTLPVESMTILFPMEESIIESFHTYDYSIEGDYPVKPALQSVGIALGEDRKKDQLNNILWKLLNFSGVDLMKNN